ncbi:MAG TPA: DUF2059 domain-containing protein [Flavobacteriaceae bacterium]|nr:DUF2059 domain-containing protein [Flavobacteriaceae bacterium]
MKKLIIVTAFLVGFTAFSQENETYKADALELVKLQTKGQFEVMLEPFLQMIPAENQKAFMADVKSKLPRLYEQIAKIYMETYTHQEIQEIMDFYNSPVGQKLIQTSPEITKKSMQAAQSWGMEMRPMLSKYTK